MRPKNFILLYCADRDLLSATAFALRLHSYDVTAVLCSTDAALIARDIAFSCAVLLHAQRDDLAGRLIHRLIESTSHMPLLLVDRAGDLAPVRYADIVLYGRNTTTAHILAALDVICHRKRGPQPRRAA